MSSNNNNNNNNVQSFLKYFTAGDVVNKNKKVITIPETSTVESALDVLKTNGILSVPVVKSDGNFVGLVNLWDVVTAVCFNQLFDSYDDEKLDKELLSNDLLTEALKVETFKKPVTTVLGLSQESKTMWVYNWDVSLDTLLDPFSKGVHRVLIKGLKPVAASSTSASTTPDVDYRFLSQTDVVRFLYYSQLKELDPVLDATITDLGLVNKVRSSSAPVVFITDKSSALTGFRKLTLHDVNAVPVIDDKTGQLVANLSASDLRGIHQDTFKLALLPVLEFLETLHGKLRPAVAVAPQDTLRKVIEAVLQNKVHRVWVLDEKKKVIGVVTLSDIICKFSPFDFKK